jgi:hypothetical protein
VPSRDRDSRRVVLNTDGRGHNLAAGLPVRVGGRVGDGSSLSPNPVADIRRFRVKHALRAIEDALILLDGERAIGVQLSALERIRDDLALVLRLAEADCR